MFIKSIPTFFLLACFISCAQEKVVSYAEEMEIFQYEMNVKFSDKKTTPLTDESFKTFKQLDFFPVDSTFRIVATFELTPNAPIFEMPTTTDRKPLYAQFGIAHFTWLGEAYAVHVYRNQKLMLDPEYRDYLFFPFNDLTNGDESYDAGRYIDLTIPTGDSIVIDFNKAYNPYCAYNDKYSCPIPPKENELNFAVRAGVKAFNKE